AGKTWVQPYTHTDIPLYDIACPNASTIIAVGQKGIIITSQDKGKNWQSDTVGTEQENFLSLAIEGETILAVTSAGTIYRSLDRGISWTSVFTLPTALSKVFSLSQGQWLIGDRRGGLWYSENNGISWTKPQSDTIFDCAHCRVKAFTRLNNNTVLALANSTLFRSTDNGKSWKKLQATLPFANDIMRHPYPLEENSIIYVDSTYGTKVYNLDQQRFRFDSVYNFEYLAGYGHGKIAMTASGKFVSIGRQKRILMRESLTDRWKLHCLTPSFLSSFIMYNDSLGWIGSINGNISRTSDGGTTWLPQDTFITINNNWRPNTRLIFLAFKDSLNIIGYNFQGGMVSSDNGGKVVKESRSRLYLPGITQLSALPGKGYYMAWNVNYQNQDSIYYYSCLSFSENGSGWDTLVYMADSGKIQDGFPAHIYYSFIHNGRLWYSISSDKNDVLYYSDDNGMTWQKANFETTIGKIHAPVFIDDTLGFMVDNTSSTQFGLLRTTDAGMTWQKMSNTIRFRQVWADPKDKNILYAIAKSKESELYRSVDKGITWTQQTIRGLNLARYAINTITTTPTQTYVQGGDGLMSFFTRVVTSGSVVGIAQEEERLPRAFVPLRWMSVYPNPFTQKTTLTMICHSLVFPNGVTIKAYNGEGTEIDDLTEEFRQGKRVDNQIVFEWSPTNLLSGVYYIQALSNGYTETIKTIYVPEKK
ncbi:MAG: YCF48-related protein, partial [Candidatus Kapaibacterium sp.]